MSDATTGADLHTGAEVDLVRFTPPPVPAAGARLRVAVLVSGGGTTLQNFLNERERGRLPIDIPVVIASRKNAYAVHRARNSGLEAHVMRRRDHGSDEAHADAVLGVCEQHEVGLICMAGYLEFLRLPERWLGRVLNIHPALLPAFGGAGMYGDRVHRQVLAYGARVTGCTVHVADNRYDHGPVILQRHVPVLQDDTPEILRARVFHEECLAYPQAIRLFAEGRVRFDGRLALIGPPRR